MTLNNNSNFQFVVSDPLRKNNLSVFFLSTEEKKVDDFLCFSFDLYEVNTCIFPPTSILCVVCDFPLKANNKRPNNNIDFFIDKVNLVSIAK